MCNNRSLLFPLYGKPDDAFAKSFCLPVTPVPGFRETVHTQK